MCQNRDFNHLSSSRAVLIKKRLTSDTFPKKLWTRSANGNKWTVASWRLSRAIIAREGFPSLLRVRKATFRIRKLEISKQVWSLSTHCTAFYGSRNESVGETFDTSSLTIVCVCKSKQNICKQFTPFYTPICIELEQIVLVQYNKSVNIFFAFAFRRRKRKTNRTQMKKFITQ